MYCRYPHTIGNLRSQTCQGQVCCIAATQRAMSRFRDVASRSNIWCLQLSIEELTGFCFDVQYGNNALHWAALKGHAETTKVLLKEGADVGVTNKVRCSLFLTILWLLVSGIIGRLISIDSFVTHLLHFRMPSRKMITSSNCIPTSMIPGPHVGSKYLYFHSYTDNVLTRCAVGQHCPSQGGTWR